MIPCRRNDRTNLGPGRVLLTLSMFSVACGGSVAAVETDGGAANSVVGTSSGPGMDAASEAAPDGAPEACTPIPPTGTSMGPLGSPSSCSSVFGKTCGTTTYQVSCDCPKGICVCFGATTTSVTYNGCPGCPGVANGPGVDEILRLCGFPEQ